MRRFLVNAAVAAAIIGAWYYWRSRLAEPARRPIAAFVRHVAPPAAPLPFVPHANPNPPGPAPGDAIVDEPSQLTAGLNSPTSDAKADLRQVNDIFMHYRSAVHGDNPIGDNVDITAVLTGRNSLGFAFIPLDCPALNANGELCDRWGTPYFFHQISGQEMGIRSAGPDRKMWTADDVVLEP